MNLKRKMNNYGKKVLANKPSDNTLRKQRRMVQRLRRSLRSQLERQRELLNEDIEKDILMQEYLSFDEEERDEQIG